MEIQVLSTESGPILCGKFCVYLIIIIKKFSLFSRKKNHYFLIVEMLVSAQLHPWRARAGKPAIPRLLGGSWWHQAPQPLWTGALPFTGKHCTEQCSVRTTHALIPALSQEPGHLILTGRTSPPPVGSPTCEQLLRRWHLSHFAPVSPNRHQVEEEEDNNTSVPSWTELPRHTDSMSSTSLKLYLGETQKPFVPVHLDLRAFFIGQSNLWERRRVYSWGFSPTSSSHALTRPNISKTYKWKIPLAYEENTVSLPICY